MQKISHIYTFINVVELGNFAKAGKAMGISNVAVMKQINALEEQLGLQLFRRTTRYLTLTDSGKAFYQHCKPIIEKLEEVENAMSSIRKEPSGELKVVSSVYFGEKYIVPHLHEYMRKFPKVKIITQLIESIENLSRDYDVLVGVPALDIPHLVQRRVITSRVILCASPAYLKKFGEPMQPSDLSQHIYVTHSFRLPDESLSFRNNIEIYPNPALVINNMASLLTCAVTGTGIVRLPLFFAEDEIRKGNLVILFPGTFQHSVNLYLYYQQSKYLEPKLRSFIDFIVPKIDYQE